MALSAAAQTRGITADEVIRYFAQVREDATELVRRGDIEAINQWSDRHVADNARFKIFVETMQGSKPKTWVASDIDKADAQHLRDALSSTLVRSIQDYSLRIQVNKVVTHGADAATVAATWSDSGKLTPPGPRAAGQGSGTVGQGQDTGASPRTLNVKRTIECDHVLAREEGQLKIGLSSCRGQVQF